ncbi:MAG: hypothetical protein WKF81_08945 [Thermomicrobiales bacterium]
MNNSERLKLIGRIRDIGMKATQESLAQYEHGLLVLRGSLAYEFSVFIGELAQKYPWNERFSEVYLRNRFIPALSAAQRGDNGSIEDCLNQIILDVETYSTERRIVIPVSRMHLSLEEFSVGRVRFWTVSEQSPLLLRSKSDSVQGSNTVDSPEMIYGDLIKDNDFIGKVVAETSVVAEHGRAIEIAEQEIRRALGIVNFANASVHLSTDQADSFAGIYENSSPTVKLSLVVSETDEVTDLQSEPSTWPIEITSALLDHFDKFGFSDLSLLLIQPAKSLTTLEDSLLLAVHWFASSQTQVELENRLLNLVTCLEALFGPRGGIAIKTSVAEATAIVVGSNLDERLDIKRFIVNAYDARSEISHGGKKAVSVALVSELRSICARVITTLVHWTTRLDTQVQLHSWLERQRLSGQSSEPIPETGKPRTIRRLREERRLTIEELAAATGISLEVMRLRDSGNATLFIDEIQKLAKAFDLHRSQIELANTLRLIEVSEHWFMLSTQKIQQGQWIARVTGWDFSEAPERPTGLLDPEDQESRSPSLLLHESWTATGYGCANTLRLLEAKVRKAMESWLTSVDNAKAN